MTFAAYETSLQNGRPVRLYQFMRGPLRWGYCSADRDVTFNGIVFRSIEGGISDDGIRQSGETSADTLVLTVPAATDIAQMYRNLAPAQRVVVTVFDMHFGDDTYLVSWSGQVIGVRFTSSISAEVQCQTLAAQLERTGLRLTFGRGCTRTLYDQECGASREMHRHDSNVVGLTGMVANVPAAGGFADDYFSGGYIEWTGEFGNEQRGIERQVGTQLFLYGGTRGLVNGQVVSIYPGCDRTFPTCGTKFNNQDNYGGAPHMPGKSPFDGSSLF